MNKYLLIIVFLIVPFFTVAQNASESKTANKKDIVKAEVAIKKIEPISSNPMIQNKTINFNKSKELTSVKAYMRSLQLKRKETLVS